MLEVANGMFGEDAENDQQYAIKASASLVNGGFVFIYDVNGSLSLSAFDANGHPAGASRLIAPSGSNPDVVALDTGGFAVVWSVGAFTQTGSIQAQTFDAAGNALGAVFTVAQSISFFERVDVANAAVTADGNLVFTWGVGDTVANRAIVGRVFDGSGAPLSNVTNITSIVQNVYSGGGESISLADGRVAIVVSAVTNGFSSGFSVRAYDPLSGSVQRDYITIVPTSGYRAISPQLTLLSSGTLAVTWTEYASIGGVNTYVLHNELYDARGVSLSTSFTTSLPSSAVGIASDVVALANGGFAIAYEAGNAEGFNLLVQIFDATGAWTGSAFAVNPPSESAPSNPVLTAFGTGDLAVAWSYSISLFESDFSLRLYHSTTTGTAAGETILGTSGVDLIHGLAGDDILLGYAGNDELQGGDGSDTLLGGAGRDQLLGDAGNDILDGGADDDVLTGGSGSDGLTGGAGADIFSDTAANFNGDRIFDLGVTDRIVIRGASLSTFSFTLSGNTLAFSGSMLTLVNVPHNLVASAAVGGGVQLAPQDAHSDFNGDGRSDLAWLFSDGTFTSWQGRPNGTFVDQGGSGANPLGANWRLVGVGDFNGDGKDDLLWRHASGEIGQWQGQSSGPFVNTSNVAANLVDNSWSVVGIADYNGDGRDDILWRHNSGAITEWLAQPNGSFINNSGVAANTVDNGWSVVASGDFNGDGRGDVLWRHSTGVYVEWQGTSSGALMNAGSVMAGATGAVVGSGDFNGDGRDDVITRAADGTIAVWLAQGTGEFSVTTPTRQIGDLNWNIVAIGDFNGDGRDDLFWRHTSGAAAEWVGTASGNFAYNGAQPTIDPNWHIQSPDIFVG